MYMRSVHGSALATSCRPKKCCCGRRSGWNSSRISNAQPAEHRSPVRTCPGLGPAIHQQELFPELSVFPPIVVLSLLVDKECSTP